MPVPSSWQEVLQKDFFLVLMVWHLPNEDLPNQRIEASDSYSGHAEKGKKIKGERKYQYIPRLIPVLLQRGELVLASPRKLMESLETLGFDRLALDHVVSVQCGLL